MAVLECRVGRGVEGGVGLVNRLQLEAADLDVAVLAAQFDLRPPLVEERGRRVQLVVEQ